MWPNGYTIHGYTIHGVDINRETVDTINRGQIHIVEPDLDMFVHAAVDSGRFTASTTPTEADVFFICVPTPFDEEKTTGIPRPNLDYVLNATKAIAPFVRPGNMVILESTSPVGTTERVNAALAAQGVDVDRIAVAYCPERVLPGKIMRELVENDRVVGGVNRRSTSAVKVFYESFVVGKILATDCRTAEMCKLVENSSRDVQIAFANELSLICDDLDIDVWELRRLANHHPRVNILQPGTGVGGHCIAVDPWFIVSRNPEQARLIRAAREINHYKTEWVIEKIKTAALEFERDHGRTAKVACLGLAFKPDIDDLRESPALTVYETLSASGLDMIAVEPHISPGSRPGLRPLDGVLQEADILVFLVAHQQFYGLKTGKKRVLDFCGVLSPTANS